MVALINVGRLVMVAWIIYSLVLVFAPALLHRPPSQISGLIQFIVAYGLGYLLDRLLGVLRRRKAAREEATLPVSDTASI